jgi:hypothetical protein
VTTPSFSSLVLHFFEEKKTEEKKEMLLLRGPGRVLSKAYYQAFFWVLIDLIVELLGLIIKPFDNQTVS